jgi:hypothetical protein
LLGAAIVASIHWWVAGNEQPGSAIGNGSKINSSSSCLELLHRQLARIDPYKDGAMWSKLFVAIGVDLWSKCGSHFKWHSYWWIFECILNLILLTNAFILRSCSNKCI